MKIYHFIKKTNNEAKWNVANCGAVMAKEGATTYRRLRGRRRYLDASSEEGSISARASKKAQSRCELRRTRYLGVSLQERAISACLGSELIEFRIII